MFQVLGRWASRSPTMEPGKPMSQVSVILSMRTMIDRSRLGDLDATLGFRFGEQEFRATLKDGDCLIDRGTAAGADTIITGDQNALIAVLYGGASYADMGDALTVEGDAALADRFAGLFPLPPKAPSTVMPAPTAS
ncbi:SCP2 sterol-binding domain-containing protein [Sphingobium sp. CR2-8]|uniref:SCP2 sterol-binding domain-containing protein n=1 Tax=Sphingobium sp. CR2-8 TaxID=1306534 RepID=UPI002DB80114|nr:SCP2 sterol-binding domain-containing protein [Sphingobium sp. CR2-8]MEC3911973.1 SCP2 sterol-binding domain-containing protein [Sphingobium sp. CR2-8]